MLRQTLSTKMHLLQAPRMSMVTSYTRLFNSSQIHRSQICTFHSSTRLNTDEFIDLLATKIDRLEADVNSIKGDIKGLDNSMREQLAGYALNQEKQISQYALNQEKQFRQFYLRSLYGVLGVAVLLIGSSWILPMNESMRLDTEIKRRAIVQEGVKALKGE